MEYDKQLETSILQALREVERDLSLPGNSLVDETPLPKISGQVRLKWMVVLLDQSTRQPHQAFEGVETPQKSCQTRRDDLAPWEGFRRTSGVVS